MNTLFHGCLSSTEPQLVKVGVVKLNICWFVLVKKSNDKKEGLGLLKGAKKTEEAEELVARCFVDPAAHRLQTMKFRSPYIRKWFTVKSRAEQ